MLRIFNRTKIAILKIHGTIGSTVKYEQIYPLIRKIERNKSVKSLIIDINSPGGGVTDSDLIFSALKKLNQKKPVISYVQGIGASGGYLIACSSNKIIASEASIVGSIGVISVRPMLVEFFKKIGIEVSVNKTGEFKDTGASWRKQTKKEGRAKEEKTKQAAEDAAKHGSDIILTTHCLKHFALFLSPSGKVNLDVRRVARTLTRSLFVTKEIYESTRHLLNDLHDCLPVSFR